jgi:hypothetical protein
MRIRIGAAAAVLILAVGSGPSAHTGVVDFTDDLWRVSKPGDTPSSRTRTPDGFGPVTIEAVTPTGGPGALSFLGDVPGGPDDPCGFLACETGGVGIGAGVASMANGERLVVTAERAFGLDRLYFRDLSAGDATGGPPRWRVNRSGPGGPLVAAASDGTPDADDGLAATERLDIPDVTEIEIFADALEPAAAPTSGVALAAIQSVPGPATLVMLGAGLLALGGGLRLSRRPRA